MDAPARDEWTFAESTQHTWVGDLRLRLAHLFGRTRVVRNEHRGPVRIQRPFYPEGEPAHIYLLHPPGGVAGGDRLNLFVGCRDGAHALLTTPTATKLYRSERKAAHVVQELRAESGTILEWLPQETIPFSSSHAHLSTRVDLEGEAKFVGWEILSLGRPASGDHFQGGCLTQTFELYRDGVPLSVDRLELGPALPTQGAGWGLCGETVHGVFLLSAGTGALADSVRAVLAERAPGRIACTDLLGVTIVRYVGNDPRQCFDLFVDVWKAVRPALLGRSAEVPRIWSY